VRKANSVFTNLSKSELTVVNIQYFWVISLIKLKLIFKFEFLKIC